MTGCRPARRPPTTNLLKKNIYVFCCCANRAGTPALFTVTVMAAPHKPVVHVVLEQCSLETVKTRTGFELLNCDDHIAVCKKNGKDPSVHRPDIVHQVLLALMDSPLNKAGHLHVLMLTKKNVLIEISPHTRIPRTFKRFCGLMGACPQCRAAQRASAAGARARALPPAHRHCTLSPPPATPCAPGAQCNCCTTSRCARQTATTR
jgi:hypothetical protein